MALTTTALAPAAPQAQLILQSHERCAAIGLSRIARPDYAPLGRPDLALVRERNRRLHTHAAPVMDMLFEQIAGTESMVVLTDSSGTIIHSIGDDDFLSRASQVALQPGVNWSEPSKGTNAIGTALVEEAPVLVHADQHYMHANHFLTCSAAPILDPRGNILGVLDVTGDHRSYHRHTMALVRLSARMIENHWLSDDPSHALRVHFHHRPEFIGTLMEGIVALSPEGRIVGANRGALEQLGASGAALRLQGLEELFGVSMGALEDHAASPLALPLAVRAANGHTLHLVARGRAGARPAARQRAAAPAPVAVPPLAPPPPLQALAGADPAMAALVQRLQRVAEGDLPVVLIGAPGTGKATLARALHAASSRAAGRCVALACEGLQADEFDGGFSAAAGGTLVLADLGALAPPLQALLLRRLRTAANGVPAPRLVCTVRLSLPELVAAGALRADLQHHLEGLALRVPRLAERSDRGPLAQRQLALLSPAARLSRPVLAVFERHDWPGNLRQLGHVLRAAVALAGPGGLIGPEHLGEGFAAAPAKPASAASLQALELQAMRDAVAAAGGNIAEAARQLGVSRNTLYRRLRWRREG